MRTAEEILQKHLNVTPDINNWPNGYPYITEAINEARKEALEECANRTLVQDDNWNPVISKEEILNLIKEIK